MKSLDVSALSFHKMMHVAEKLDALNEWGSIVALTYIAAQKTFPFYTDMADAKATLRVNSTWIWLSFREIKKNKSQYYFTISYQKPQQVQGIEGFDDFFDFANKISPLGNASAEDCANYCITLFSDYSRMVTMQNLFHDGGFSTTGISEEIMDVFKK